MDASDAASAAGPAFEASPFCRHIQSKKLFFRTTPPQCEEDILDASRHAWCRRTHQILGPDGEVAAPEDCRSGRSCFEGLL